MSRAAGHKLCASFGVWIMNIRDIPVNDAMRSLEGWRLIGHWKCFGTCLTYEKDGAYRYVLPDRDEVLTARRLREIVRDAWVPYTAEDEAWFSKHILQL